MPVQTKAKTEAERREWLRIDDRLPLEFRRHGDSEPIMASMVDSEALRSIQEFLAKPAQELVARTGQNDPQSALVPWVLKMDWALGVILGALTSLAPRGLAVPRMTDVNISATGMNFPSSQTFEVGDILDVKLILPPFLPIHTMAEVVRVSDIEEHPAGRYLLAVSFSDLRADDQDHLIRHILNLQAERLRTQHRDGDR
ncbi:pilus assembly protein PilZ [Nitrospira sp.]|nr:pilus assembly protein PilZ [Nitrospira sp.]